MIDHIFNKAHIRNDLRQRRRSLRPADQLAAAEAVTHFVAQLPGWSSARRIALYLPSDGEVDTTPLGSMCRGAGMQVFLPVIERTGLLVFAEWRQDGHLVKNRYGILEPDDDAARCPVAEFDIIVLPLVAWDREGGRLGMGAGFYDRALEGTKNTLLVGLSHSLQQVSRVPCDNWDVPLDFVVTDTALHCCRGNN